MASPAIFPVIWGANCAVLASGLAVVDLVMSDICYSLSEFG
jgi:hypothetical protein